MPAPLDLTGRRFGQLTVLERAGRARWGRDQAAWRCRCDCGALIVLPQNRLPHRASIQASHVVDACDACRRGPCAVCGRRIPADRSLQATTCSDDCRRNAHRLIWRSYHHRQAASDPDYHTRRHEARKARAAEDPAYAERLRRIDRRAKRRNAAKRTGLAVYLPAIAAGTLDAEAVVRFAGQRTLLTRLATLPVPEQRRLTKGGALSVAVRTADGAVVPRQMPAASLTAQQARMVIDGGRIRSMDEQKDLLASEAGDDLVSDSGIRLTAADHRALVRAAAERGVTLPELVRRTLADAGLLRSNG